jgi:hypothetical protein
VVASATDEDAISMMGETADSEADHSQSGLIRDGTLGDHAPERNVMTTGGTHLTLVSFNVGKDENVAIEEVSLCGACASPAVVHSTLQRIVERRGGRHDRQAEVGRQATD